MWNRIKKTAPQQNPQEQWMIICRVLPNSSVYAIARAESSPCPVDVEIEPGSREGLQAGDRVLVVGQYMRRPVVRRLWSLPLAA